MNKGRLIFKNLDSKRMILIAEAEVILMKAGITFDGATSSDKSQREWIINEDAEGVELEVKVFDDCTCPCMKCDKVCCPHRQNPYYDPYGPYYDPYGPYIHSPYTYSTGDAWTIINTTNTAGVKQ